MLSVLIGISVLSVHCAKEYNLQDADRKYLITERELVPDMPVYTVVKRDNGKEYFFSRTVNDYGLYVLYSITLTDPQKNDVKLMVRANKFYTLSGIDRLYVSDAYVKKLNGDFIVNFDFKKYNFDRGFYIDKPDLQIFEVVRGSMIYAVQTEGFFKLSPEKLCTLIDSKMKELEHWK